MSFSHPAFPDGDEIMSMQRKSLKQLLREQRHVAQNPAATSPAPVSSAEPSVRPYGKRTWPGVPTDALDVKQVGWKEKGNGTETEEKVAAEPSVEEAKKTAEKPATQKEKGAVAKGGKPPAKGAADVGGFKVVAGRKNSSGTPDPTDGATSTGMTTHKEQAKRGSNRSSL